MSPVVIIPKKERKVNKITEQDSFPIPRNDDILDRLR
jgi:hypothetical protein